MRHFDAKLRQACAARGDRLLYLRPVLTQMPLPIQRYDDPFLPFSKAIINATCDLVCGYLFDFAAYLTLGAAGAVALERAIAYAGADSATITILHAPLWGVDFARAMGETAFNVDAVTLVRAEDTTAYAAEGVGALLVDAVDFAGGAMRHADLTLRLIGDVVVYAGRGDDFAEQARAALLG